MSRQSQIRDNTYKLKKALAALGIDFPVMNYAGACQGVVLKFLMGFDRKDDADQFNASMEWLANLQESYIEELVRYIKNKKDLKFFVSEGESKIKFIKIIDNIKAANDYYDIPDRLEGVFKMIRANWDNTQSIACKVSEVQKQLENCRFQDGHLIQIELGFASNLPSHTIGIGIEKDNLGKEIYTLCDPNEPEKKTNDIAAIAKIIEYYYQKFYKEQNQSGEMKVKLIISYLSYGNDAAFENDIMALKRLIQTEVNANENLNQLLYQFEIGRISQVDFALACNAELQRVQIAPLFEDYLKKFVSTNELIEKYIHTLDQETKNDLLLITAAAEQPEAVKLLLNNGADPESKQSRRGTALKLAVDNKCVLTAKELLKYGANPNSQIDPFVTRKNNNTNVKAINTALKEALIIYEYHLQDNNWRAFILLLKVHVPLTNNELFTKYFSPKQNNAENIIKAFEDFVATNEKKVFFKDPFLTNVKVIAEDLRKSSTTSDFNIYEKLCSNLKNLDLGIDPDSKLMKLYRLSIQVARADHYKALQMAPNIENENISKPENK